MVKICLRKKRTCFVLVLRTPGYAKSTTAIQGSSGFHACRHSNQKIPSATIMLSRMRERYLCSAPGCPNQAKVDMFCAYDGGDELLQCSNKVCGYCASKSMYCDDHTAPDAANLGKDDPKVISLNLSRIRKRPPPMRIFLSTPTSFSKMPQTRHPCRLRNGMTTH